MGILSFLLLILPSNIMDWINLNACTMCGYAWHGNFRGLNIFFPGINPRNSAKKDSPNSMWNSPLGKPSVGALPSVGAKNSPLGKLWQFCSSMQKYTAVRWILLHVNNMKFFDLWQAEDQAAMGQGTMLTMLAMFLPFCQILKVAQVSIVAF